MLGTVLWIIASVFFALKLKKKGRITLILVILFMFSSSLLFDSFVIIYYCFAISADNDLNNAKLIKNMNNFLR